MKAITVLIIVLIFSSIHSALANPCPDSNRYAKKPDGCSSWSDNPQQFRDRWGSVNFRPSCMAHDRCYYTLGTSESSCNNAFSRNLLAACRDGLRVCTKVLGKKICSPPEPASFRACAAFAGGMVTLVRAASRSVYRKAQRKQREHENQCAASNSRISRVDASINWRNGHSYFFKDSKYHKFDIKEDRTVSGYPLPIAGNWPGLWSNGVDAVINWGNGYAYFFKGSQYIKYDMKKDRAVNGYPLPIKGNWPGLWSSGVDAVINWGNSHAYFFKGSQYIKYDMKKDRVVSGYPLPIKGNWPGLWSDNIDSAVNWGNGYAYFFKDNQYIKYDMKKDRAVSGYPANIKDHWK